MIYPWSIDPRYHGRHPLRRYKMIKTLLLSLDISLCRQSRPSPSYATRSECPAGTIANLDLPRIGTATDVLLSIAWTRALRPLRLVWGGDEHQVGARRCRCLHHTSLHGTLGGPLEKAATHVPVW